MKPSHYRRPVLAFAGALAALATISVPAVAQDKYVYADEIVVVPYGVQSRTIGRSTNGAPIEAHSLSRVVTTEGLDLRHDADVYELQRRVEYTARMLCNELDREVMDVSLTTDRECRRDAVRDAMAQVDDAVYRARG